MSPSHHVHHVSRWLAAVAVALVSSVAVACFGTDVYAPCKPAEVGGSWCALAIVQLSVPGGGPPRSLKVQSFDVSTSASGVVDAPFGSTDAKGNVRLEFRFLAQPSLYRDSAQILLAAIDPTRLTNQLVDSTRVFVHYFPVGGPFVTDTIRWTLSSAP